jgi:hypothetical protein
VACFRRGSRLNRCAAEERQKDLLLLEQGGDGGSRLKPLVPKAIDADESDPDDSDDSDESDDEVCVWLVTVEGMSNACITPCRWLPPCTAGSVPGLMDLLLAILH